MLFGATDDGGRDLVRLLRPRLSARPTARAYQVSDSLSDRDRLRDGLGPCEAGREATLERDQEEPRAKLRDPKVGRVEKAPEGGVAQRVELLDNLRAVRGELLRGETAHIFQHDRARLDLLD